MVQHARLLDGKTTQPPGGLLPTSLHDGDLTALRYMTTGSSCSWEQRLARNAARSGLNRSPFCDIPQIFLTCSPDPYDGARHHRPTPTGLACWTTLPVDFRQARVARALKALKEFRSPEGASFHGWGMPIEKMTSPR